MNHTPQIQQFVSTAMWHDKLLVPDLESSPAELQEEASTVAAILQNGKHFTDGVLADRLQQILFAVTMDGAEAVSDFVQAVNKELDRRNCHLQITAIYTGYQYPIGEFILTSSRTAATFRIHLSGRGVDPGVLSYSPVRFVFLLSLLGDDKLFVLISTGIANAHFAQNCCTKSSFHLRYASLPLHRGRPSPPVFLVYRGARRVKTEPSGSLRES